MDNKRSLSSLSNNEIEDAVSNKYSEVAINPSKSFNFPVGKGFAVSCGYPKEVLENLPETLYDSFSGANNPQPFVEIRKGEIVLDLGCGAGLDLYFYAKTVGPQGKVYGVDISEPMIRKATENMIKVGIKNTEIKQGRCTDIPIQNNTLDIVASMVYTILLQTKN